MEALKESFATISEMFNARMSEFQRELQKSSPVPVTASSLAEEFSSFKKFIASVLETMQKQIEFLSRDIDRMELQRRRKIILLHGISEDKTEDTAEVVSKLISNKLKVPDASTSCISRCHRLGRTAGKKPRPIIVKFREVSMRDKTWFSKTKLKGSGITQSEFLTRNRHNIFLEARKRHGITNCWTKDGIIHVLASDGSIHQVESLSELDAVPIEASPASSAQSTATDGKPSVKSFANQFRTKRTTRK
ncbi:protein unc-13 homolog C-like [Papilio machaon]|uniref:protein unc-13 homolog C-like n=1 Tax=Papilio machaon TaxID=76193 RepID=UPI001E664E00|nr:protein unc-13 homolog C-like [Papilio machaon]